MTKFSVLDRGPSAAEPTTVVCRSCWNEVRRPTADADAPRCARCGARLIPRDLLFDNESRPS